MLSLTFPYIHIPLYMSMDGGAWWAAVHGVAKSRTRLRDFTFTFAALVIKQEDIYEALSKCSKGKVTGSQLLVLRIVGIYGAPQHTH